MKRIRRITSALICLLLCALCAFSAFAGSTSYTIDKLGMTVEFPSSMSVTTKDSGELGANTYLEAKIPADDFSITITMITDDNTSSIGELSSLSSTALKEFKESLEKAELEENSLTEEIRSATWGETLYIDLAQKQYLENDVVSYIRQSMTIKNGMGIYITSVSVGDDFTSEELDIIRGCLKSITYEEIKEGSKTSVWKVILWILLILVLLLLCFFGFVFFMRKRNASRRKALNLENMGSGDYRTPRKSSKSGTVGGFKTSSDYFLKGYDMPEEKASAPQAPKHKDSPSKPVSKEGALRRTGYFLTNLKREIKKNNRRKASKSKGRGARIQSKDYDVFRDR